ncbi:MAG: AAA family ATPase [Oscillospiraceae bacterium]|nr:AAA family ATPase [Oscillospiraceae bacterium]
MKEIKIAKLSLRNFKGCESLELDLEGKNASIYGDNATGKTTVYDAVTWLLFGKDSLGQSNDENIKPLDANGAVKDHEAVTVVEAELEVCEDGRQIAGTTGGTGDPSPTEGNGREDGRQIAGATVCRQIAGATVTLRKELRELWTARRGTSQLVYGGNTVAYFVDGVPTQKKGYTARIGELVQEDTFRMLTSATAFAVDLHWQKRRAVLADMSGAGALTDRALLQEAVREAQQAVQEAASAREAEEHQQRGERFSALLDALEGRSLEDEKKVLAQERRNLTAVKDQAPARLDELNKQGIRLEALDFAGAARELQAARENGDRLRQEIAQASAGGRDPALQKAMEDLAAKRQQLQEERASYRDKHMDLVFAVRNELYALDAEERKIQRAQEEAAGELRRQLGALGQKKAEFRAQRDEIAHQIADMERTAEQLRAHIRQDARRATDLEAEAEALGQQVEADRSKWLEVSNQSFGGATCPTCGQELPMEQMQAARERFEREKAGRLEQIRMIAGMHLDREKQLRTEAEQSRQKAALTQETLDNTLAQLEDLRAHLPAEEMPGYRVERDRLERELARIEGREGGQIARAAETGERRKALQEKLAGVEASAELPDYRGRLAELDALEEHLKAQESEDRAKERQKVEGLRNALEAVEGRVRAAEAILNQKPILDYVHKRTGELREEQKRAAAALEQAEKLSFTIEEFIRWKTRFVEDSVNGLFRLVSFRLFREQANGGLAECCDVTVDGVPYAALNNGARINAGLDIIRQLSEHYGVRVPLFVDNAEGVTRLEDAGTQVIRLVVSAEDKSLRVEI